MDRDRQKKVREYAKKLERNFEQVRDAERKKHAQERRASERAVDDARRVYDMHDAIAVCALLNSCSKWIDATGVADMAAAAEVVSGERLATVG